MDYEFLKKEKRKITQLKTIEEVIIFLKSLGIKKDLERKYISVKEQLIEFGGSLEETISDLNNCLKQCISNGNQNIRIIKEYDGEYDDRTEDYYLYVDRLETDSEYIKRLKDRAKQIIENKINKIDSLDKAQKEYSELQKKMDKLKKELGKDIISIGEGKSETDY